MPLPLSLVPLHTPLPQKEESRVRLTLSTMSQQPRKKTLHAVLSSLSCGKSDRYLPGHWASPWSFSIPPPSYRPWACSVTFVVTKPWKQVYFLLNF